MVKRVKYHEQSPHGVVDEDGGCCEEHAETHETVELEGGTPVSSYCNYDASVQGELTILNACCKEITAREYLVFELGLRPCI